MIKPRHDGAEIMFEIYQFFMNIIKDVMKKK